MLILLEPLSEILLESCLELPKLLLGVLDLLLLLELLLELWLLWFESLKKKLSWLEIIEFQLDFVLEELFLSLCSYHVRYAF